MTLTMYEREAARKKELIGKHLEYTQDIQSRYQQWMSTSIYGAINRQYGKLIGTIVLILNSM